jgi:dTDP-4-amino-4,6-dideoxygalactose transaminase
MGPLVADRAASWRVPFFRPTVADRELEYVATALSGRQRAGDGEFTRRCEGVLREILGGSSVLLTPSGTHALELAALLLDVGPGDEVVVPSFTFPSTANAFALRGASIRFADIDPETLNIDPGSLARVVTARTKAVAVVHYAGISCSMTEIGALVSGAGIPVVEDNAHGLFGELDGRPLGTLGALAALSFHETKNVSCGEGGALVVNDERHVRRAEILREKGTDRARFLRKEIDRYTWVDLGSSFLLAETLAAILLAQLEMRERIQARRRSIWNRYADDLAEWADRTGFRLPVVPADRHHPAHLFYLLAPSPGHRERFIAHLASHGVQATFHFLPLHLSVMGQRYGAGPADCPVATDVSERLVRLPFFFDLSEIEQSTVIDAVRSFPNELV